MNAWRMIMKYMMKNDDNLMFLPLFQHNWSHTEMIKKGDIEKYWAIMHHTDMSWAKKRNDRRKLRFEAKISITEIWCSNAFFDNCYLSFVR